LFFLEEEGVSLDVRDGWYALVVRARREKLVERTLRLKGYETILPLYEKRVRWADRTKTEWYPLFPGYLFCNFEVNRRLPILTTPGVIRIVSVGNTPHPLDDAEIEAMHRLQQSELPRMPHPNPESGQPILIVRGPLRGVRGVVQNPGKDYRVVLSVSLLQRSVAVQVSVTDFVWLKSSQHEGGVVRRFSAAASS
jgi:transcription antitermination factor NusG